MPNICTDIETLPASDPAALAEMKAEIDEAANRQLAAIDEDSPEALAELKAPASYKDEAKIAAWIEAKRNEVILKATGKRLAIITAANDDLLRKIGVTSFDSILGRIACVCIAVDDDKPQSFAAILPGDERSMLQRLFAAISEATTLQAHQRQVDADACFIGHNIAGFDLPFLHNRARILSVRPPPALAKAFRAKPWESNLVSDTMLMWSQDRTKRISQDKLAKALGLAGKGDFDGSMVAATWPTDPQRVIDYNVSDVETVRLIYKRLTFQTAA